jgi:hypothetical protein
MSTSALAHSSNSQAVAQFATDSVLAVAGRLSRVHVELDGSSFGCATERVGSCGER